MSRRLREYRHVETLARRMLGRYPPVLGLTPRLCHPATHIDASVRGFNDFSSLTETRLRPLRTQFVSDSATSARIIRASRFNSSGFT